MKKSSFHFHVDVTFWCALSCCNQVPIVLFVRGEISPNVLPQSSGRPIFFLRINKILFRIKSWSLRIILWYVFLPLFFPGRNTKFPKVPEMPSPTPSISYYNYRTYRRQCLQVNPYHLKEVEYLKGIHFHGDKISLADLISQNSFEKNCNLEY